MPRPVTACLAVVVAGFLASTASADSLLRIQKVLDNNLRSGGVSKEIAQDLIDRCFDIATEKPATEEAGQALAKVMEISRFLPEEHAREQREIAAERVASDFGDSPMLAAMISRIRYMDMAGAEGPSAEEAEQYLELLLSGAKTDEAKAAGLMTKAYRILDVEEHKGLALTDEQRTTAKALLEKVKATYPEVKDERGRTYGDAATVALFALENLRIGAIAPDIAGKDMDGVEFKLSDYRGKVVMLDFWADW